MKTWERGKREGAQIVEVEKGERKRQLSYLKKG
jgi:hypothetical protein